MIKPEIIDVDDGTDFKYELFNWIQDMEIEFSNSRRYRERILFCQDVIDLFAWKEDTNEGYKAAIGEALNDLKRYKECDEWLDNWLKEEPNNVNCINVYIFCTCGRGDLEKAKRLTEKHISLSMYFDDENEVLIYRAQDVYERLGEIQKVKQYQKKADEVQQWYEKNMEFYDDESAEPVYYSQPIVKEKIGRNEPCPCGSGKKYKKCCGKNL